MPSPTPSLAPSSRPGHVGGDEAPLLVGHVDHAQHRRQRREGVVGHLGFGVRDAAQQRRLARVGQAGQPHVGHELEGQREPPLLAVLAELGELGRLADRGDEAGVAAPAQAAGGDQHPLPRHDEVGQQLVVAPDLGTEGDVDEEVGAGGALTARALAVPAGIGLEVHLMPETAQVAELGVGPQVDTAARPPVASVGAAARHVLLAAERHRAVAALAGRHVDLCAIVEHDGQPAERRDRSGASPAATPT